MVSSWTMSGYLSIERNRTSRLGQAGIRVEVLAVLRREPLAGPLVPLLEIARRQHVGEDVDLHGRHLSPRALVRRSCGPLRCSRVADPGLVRSLRLPQATALVVGTILGASVFVQASELTEHVPRIWAVLLAWSVSGVLTLFGALACAELASAFPAHRRRLRLPEGNVLADRRLPLGLGDVLGDALGHHRGDGDGVRPLRRRSSSRSATAGSARSRCRRSSASRRSTTSA